MKKSFCLIIIAMLSQMTVINNSAKAQSGFNTKSWMTGPFVKPVSADAVILGPNFNKQFFDPILKWKTR